MYDTTLSDIDRTDGPGDVFLCGGDDMLRMSFHKEL